MTEPAVIHSGELAPATAQDTELLQRLREGNGRAYEELILRFQHPVHNLIYRLMNDPADTADVVQEVFLKVFRNVGAFRGQSSLKTWIYRIAVNEAYNHRRWFCRHQRQEVTLSLPDEDREQLDRMPDPGRSPFDQVADLETRALIETALADLNPKFRTAVVLRDIEDLSYEEIAQVLDISLGTVKSRILRGRDALRRNLAGRLEAEPAMHWAPQTAE